MIHSSVHPFSFSGKALRAIVVLRVAALPARAPPSASDPQRHDNRLRDLAKGIIRITQLGRTLARMRARMRENVAVKNEVGSMDLARKAPRREETFTILSNSIHGTETHLWKVSQNRLENDFAKSSFSFFLLAASMFATCCRMGFGIYLVPSPLSLFLRDSLLVGFVCWCAQMMHSHASFTFMDASWYGNSLCHGMFHRTLRQRKHSIVRQKSNRRSSKSIGSTKAWITTMLWLTMGQIQAFVPGTQPSRTPVQRSNGVQPQVNSNQLMSATDYERAASMGSSTALFSGPHHSKITPMDTSTATLLAPWEAWCLLRLETWYREALAIRCPFFRRRASDALDALEQVVRFLVIRHKSLELIGPPVGWRCEGGVCEKEMYLPTEVVLERIRKDWHPHNHKGYYITGRLSTELYRDDCFFDGPDPDMPVQGLRKYLNAASQLFETKTSTAELLDLYVDPETHEITAKWRMNGVLRLPWRPKLPEWTGSTTYHRDENGLIYKHTETWDLSVAQAFLKTLWPELAEKIWKEMKDTYDDHEEECRVGYIEDKVVSH